MNQRRSRPGKKQRSSSDGRRKSNSKRFGNKPNKNGRLSSSTEEIKGLKLNFEELALRTTKEIEKRAAKHIHFDKVNPNNTVMDLTLDDWQKEVFDHLESGVSVVVDAPTTAGKTRAVEAYFLKYINSLGFRAVYTTPVKSLSNDKVKEFREMFGENKVGIATGDIKENLNAPLVVATLESYRNSLLGTEPDLDRNLAVFDEYHFMADHSRGSAWEEALILTPPECQVLLLSASVKNGEDFSSWLDHIRKRPCELVRTLHRPVPLDQLVYIGGKWVLRDFLPESAFKFKNRDLMKIPLKQEEQAPRIALVEQLKLTPCIVYVGKRQGCESMAHHLANNLAPLDPDASLKISESLRKTDEQNQALKFMGSQVRMLIQRFGVAFHHSGLALPVRVAIENLVKEGLVRYCVSTMGLSIGINFSVKSAIITDYQRPGEGGMVSYPEAEVLQMLGRAGRRGKDNFGYSLWINKEAYSKFGSSSRQETSSSLKIDPATFLSLLGRDFTLPMIEKFYEKSFMRFGNKGIDYALATPRRLAKKLKTKELPCVSPAGEYAAYHLDQENVCISCPHQTDCHQYMDQKCSSELSALHFHLHAIHAIDRKEELTAFGSLARYIPQTGGLMISDLISAGTINADNLAKSCELFAALSTARFKKPGYKESYKFPFRNDDLEKKLEYYYPESLFPGLYDPPFGRRSYSVIREYNEKVGFLIAEWISGAEWSDLTREVSNEFFGNGDIMAVIYRTATYLQSIGQTSSGEISEHAYELRSHILREPLELTL